MNLMERRPWLVVMGETPKPNAAGTPSRRMMLDHLMMR